MIKVKHYFTNFSMKIKFDTMTGQFVHQDLSVYLMLSMGRIGMLLNPNVKYEYSTKFKFVVLQYYTRSYFKYVLSQK